MPVDLTKDKTLQRDLAGNAFSGTTFISFLLTFLFTVPWAPEVQLADKRRRLDRKTSEDCDDVGLVKAVAAINKRRRR